MENITSSIFRRFKGMRPKDLNTFLFEFETLCRCFGYSLHTQKLNLFPETLRNKGLIWCMNLGKIFVRTWDDMKQEFLEKHKY